MFDARHHWHRLLKWQHPSGLTSAGWDAWERTSKTLRPIGYSLAVDLPDALEKFCSRITAPWRALRAFWRALVSDRWHVIHTGLTVGYHDCDERMLHANFQLLQDFVELELAAVQFCSPESASPPHATTRSGFLWQRRRSKEAGLAYLAWAQTLRETSAGEDARLGFEHLSAQAIEAQEQEALYRWWTEVRPARADAYDASGYTAFKAAQANPSSCACPQGAAWHAQALCACAPTRDVEALDVSASLTWAAAPCPMAQSRALLKKTQVIEAQYEQEDEEALIRLMRIRRKLWT